MRLLLRVLSLFILTISLLSCSKNIKTQQLPAHMVIGKNYYTQFVIPYEKAAHLTTNYRRGEFIPVNTSVRLLKVTNKTIELELNSLTRPLVIKNVPKHTGDSVYQAFDKLFAENTINLNRFSSQERAQIRKGTVANGMSKNAVLVAIGYPPITETPTLNSDTWVYWSGRFNKFKVFFRNDRVSSIVD